MHVIHFTHGATDPLETQDADQLARSLIVDTEGQERNWRN